MTWLALVVKQWIIEYSPEIRSSIGIVILGLIGWFHSWLVIKMFFWPRNPVFLFGWKVPLTPGLFIAGRDRFAKELAAMLVTHFLDATSVNRALGQALESGAIKVAIRDEIISSKNSIAVIALKALSSKVAALTPEEVAAIANRLSHVISTSGAVEAAVTKGIAEMSPEEVEHMVTDVIHRELRAVIWLGFPIGAGSAVIHGLLQWILSQ